MFNFLNNVPIFRRLLIIFAFATVIPVIVVIALGNFFLSALDQRAQAVSTAFDAQSVASQEQNNLQLMNKELELFHNNIYATLSGSVQDASLNASGALIDGDIIARKTEFQQALQNYDDTYEIATSDNMATIRTIIQRDVPSTDPRSQIIQTQRDALDAMDITLWPQYKALLEKVLTKLENIKAAYLQPTSTPLTRDQITAQYESVYPTLYQVNTVFTDLSNKWQLVTNNAVETGKLVTLVGPSLTQLVWNATIIAVSSVLLLGLIAALIINLTITKPLSRMAALTRRIVTGDRSARVQIRGTDEINQVAISMNMMLDNIVQLIRAAEQQRDELQTQIDKLLGEVSGVGEGNLSVQAQITNGAMGALAASFNYMIEELSNLVVRVKMVAGEVESTTEMTLERMMQLVISADTQIKQITQTSVEVERMAQSSHLVADRTEALYNSALDARQTAQMGRHSVQLTVEGIERIQEHVQNTSHKVQTLGERSRAINNVVEMIANIVHQTNRLSLDAAIQAAMAGESGKGFRAVADDIRRLAEDAKNQANAVTQLVRSLREDIGAVAISMKDTERETLAGSQLTQQTGYSLDAIFSVVEQQAQEIALINQSARQQSLSSNTIVQIMQDVSDATLQNTTSTHAVEQSMKRLARLAQQLQASVDAFKLRDENSVGYLSEIQAEDTSMKRNGHRRTPTHNFQPVEAVQSANATVAVGGNVAFASRSFASYPQNANWPTSYPPSTPDQKKNSPNQR